MKWKTSTKYFLGIALIMTGVNSQAQHNNELYNNGAEITVQNGAEVHVWGDVHMRGGSMDNNGLVKVQGNMYANNTFQQRSTGGTGIVRLENSDVNTNERQFIQGSYAVRGGQTQINTNDGAFQHLQLANSQGIVYLVADANSTVGAENLVADVKGSVDFRIGGAPVNRIVTRDIGLTGVPAFANGSAHDAIFGMMNNAPGAANFIDETIDLTGSNTSTLDEGYVEGKLRRAIAPGGGTYGYFIGLEPTGINNSRGFQYTHLEFDAGNSYDVVTGHFEAGSPNASAVQPYCTGNYQIDYFGGADHGEWHFDDIAGITSAPYRIKIWPQNDNLATGTVWVITKDDAYVGVGNVNECGPAPVGLERGGYTSFSDFSLASGTILLEVDIIDLTATPINNNYIQVDWATSKERDLDYFEVERSVDDMNFETIGSQNAVGNSSTQQSYTLDDKNVLPNTNYYYRIKAINRDGSFEYTHSVVASLKQTGENLEAVKIYPNPVKGGAVTIDFTSVKERELNIVVYDAIGQLIQSKQTPVQEGFNQFALETTHWPSGVYFIHMVGRDFSIVKELVKGE